ncbi:MAG: Txe/YoeB family addiction module toxin [Selenomonadaceae bacterium]|nr:Txe/YoeB family addiction module toxin [Selenomonadaceae bacterium]
MILAWSEAAWDDYCYWQNQDKKTLKRINHLIKDIQRNLYTGIGNPEPLKHDLNRYWSRQIDDKNRLVYNIKKDVIYIIQCGSHYRDK